MGTAAAICRVAAMAIDNADLYDTMAATNRETEMLNSIAREAAASLDVGEIARAATAHLRELLPFETSVMVLVDDDRLHVVHADATERSFVDVLEGLPVAEAPREFREALLHRPVTVLRGPRDNPLAVGHPELVADGTTVLVALTLEGRLAGGLVLHDPRSDAFDTLDTRLLERVSTQLALAVKNARLYADVKAMHLSNLKALSAALNAKDVYTLGHAARVSAYMVLLGSRLGWTEERVRGAEEAAYLHDIGKIGISDRVLLKPGMLNSEEWDQMRQHPVLSADIIRTLFEEDLVLGVRHHHERWDGGGYPDGLSGEEIPLAARVMCVVDSYDAMSFHRPYRQALDADGCLDELRRCRGLQFDPAITDAFLDVLGELETRRRQADEVAAQAAARIDADRHLRLRRRQDESGRRLRRDRRAAARGARRQPSDHAPRHPGPLRPALRAGRGRRGRPRGARAARHRRLPRRGHPGAAQGARRRAAQGERPVRRPVRRVGDRHRAHPRSPRRRGGGRGRQPAALRRRPAGRSAGRPARRRWPRS